MSSGSPCRGRTRIERPASADSLEVNAFSRHGVYTRGASSDPAGGPSAAVPSPIARHALRAGRVRFHPAQHPGQLGPVARAAGGEEDRPSVLTCLAALGGDSPPEALVAGIYVETEGNPFFVEEVYQHLEDERALHREDGTWGANFDLGADQK